MKIRIFEPELMARRGFNGFYRHFLSALVEHLGARGTDAPRPILRMMRPKEHESCWVEWNGALVFFDMSDHVQLFDLEALKLCSVYFKANLHRGIARRTLRTANLMELESRLVPFLFFSEGLSDFQRDYRWRRFWRTDQPRYDVCFIMGVYENLVRDGKRSPFEHADEPMTPAGCHFWIRWHIMREFQSAGIPGYYRLSSRANCAIEDGINVRSNLSRRAFSRRISDARITAVCTFPHALFPWKASESFALGRPIMIEQKPLTETPDPFMPVDGEHYLELLPETGTFDENASLSDSESHRILARIPLERFREQAEWLRGVLEDRERMAAMGEACRQFARKAYDKKTVAEYIRTEVERQIV